MVFRQQNVIARSSLHPYVRGMYRRIFFKSQWRIWVIRWFNFNVQLGNLLLMRKSRHIRQSFPKGSLSTNMKKKSFGTNGFSVIHLMAVVIVLATGPEVRGFKHGRDRWIFSELKNPEYDFLRKGSKAVGPVS